MGRTGEGEMIPTILELTSIGTLIVATAAFIQSRFNSRRMKTIEIKTDGMIIKIEDAAKALGNLEGRKELRAEQTQDKANADTPLPVTDSKTAEAVGKVVEAIQEQSNLSQKV